MKNTNQAVQEIIPLEAQPSRLIRHVDKRLMSYNIEMTEITGGTFWKAYTPEQIAGAEAFSHHEFTGCDCRAGTGAVLSPH